jgi:hypothetical protein
MELFPAISRLITMPHVIKTGFFRLTKRNTVRQIRWDLFPSPKNLRWDLFPSPHWLTHQ